MILMLGDLNDLRVKKQGLGALMRRLAKPVLIEQQGQLI